MIWFQCTGITAIRPAFREHDANVDPREDGEQGSYSINNNVYILKLR
ncbi:MAG TPA: hypothetical protein PLU94_00590 [Methanoregulaceae archaeon]|nr:hypothetical protein [Methanoregulaceae archaeon]